MIKITSTLDLENRSRLLNLLYPVSGGEMATKGYVEDQASYISTYNEFSHIPPGQSNYTLVESDFGKMIEVDTTTGSTTIELPSSLADGWWCTLIKESNNFVVYLNSTLPIKGKGSIMEISRSPCMVTMVGGTYWRAIGELAQV